MYRKNADYLRKIANFLEKKSDFYNAQIIKVLEFEGTTEDKVYFLTNNFSLVDIIEMIDKSDIEYKVQFVAHLKDIMDTDTLKSFFQYIANLYGVDVNSRIMGDLKILFEVE